MPAATVTARPAADVGVAARRQRGPSVARGSSSSPHCKPSTSTVPRTLISLAGRELWPAASVTGAGARVVYPATTPMNTQPPLLEAIEQRSAIQVCCELRKHQSPRCKRTASRLLLAQHERPKVQPRGCTTRRGAAPGTSTCSPAVLRQRREGAVAARITSWARREAAPPGRGLPRASSSTVQRLDERRLAGSASVLSAASASSAGARAAAAATGVLHLTTHAKHQPVRRQHDRVASSRGLASSAQAPPAQASPLERPAAAAPLRSSARCAGGCAPSLYRGARKRAAAAGQAAFAGGVAAAAAVAVGTPRPAHHRWRVGEAYALEACISDGRVARVGPGACLGPLLAAW